MRSPCFPRKHCWPSLRSHRLDVAVPGQTGRPSVKFKCRPSGRPAAQARETMDSAETPFTMRDARVIPPAAKAANCVCSVSNAFRRERLRALAGVHARFHHLCSANTLHHLPRCEGWASLYVPVLQPCSMPATGLGCELVGRHLLLTRSQLNWGLRESNRSSRGDGTGTDKPAWACTACCLFVECAEVRTLQRQAQRGSRPPAPRSGLPAKPCRIPSRTPP